jgi:hypothetical protein
VLGCTAQTRIALRFIAIKKTIAIFIAMKDKEVLQVVQGNAPLGQDTLRALRNIASLKPTIARVRKALDNLKRAGILAKPGGSYIVEDRLFAEYLATITGFRRA